MLTASAVLAGAGVGSNLLTGYVNYKNKKTYYTGKKTLNVIYSPVKIHQSPAV